MSNFADQYSATHTLSESQTDQLEVLFQKQWWSGGRSADDVRRLLRHSNVVFGIIDNATQELVAFARVLTDTVIKAWIFDVIVHEDHRGTGLGTKLMEQILAHPEIKAVRHVELYCRSEKLEFYQRHGFSADLGDVNLMRRLQPDLG